MPMQFLCSACGKKVRAPDDAAGKKCRCPHCQAVISVPEAAVVEAEEVEQPIVLEEAPAVPADEQRRPCPMCGESILVSAVKCRYCGEIFDEDLRRLEKKKRKKGRSDDDADLTPVEWVACFLCPGIACICGLVYLMQGKAKAGKVLGISVAMIAFWTLVRVVLTEMAHVR